MSQVAHKIVCGPSYSELSDRHIKPIMTFSLERETVVMEGHPSFKVFDSFIDVFEKDPVGVGVFSVSGFAKHQSVNYRFHGTYDVMIRQGEFFFSLPTGREFRFT